MNLSDSQRLQKNIMYELLKFINKYDKQTTVLKGGTGLMFGYHLDRFSEDIDLDSTNTHLEKLIKEYCEIKSYSYNVKKDTPFVKRYMLEYDDNKKIKIEISHRVKNISNNDFTNYDGIKIYNIDKLAIMKLNAYNGRDKIRDLYDVVFIFKNYKEQLPLSIIEQFKYALSYKGLEQFDYLIQTQDDELIDKDKLANDFLQIFDDLDLIDNRTLEKQETIEHSKNIKERINDAKKIKAESKEVQGKKKDIER